jgi:hypothetical protein
MFDGMSLRAEILSNAAAQLAESATQASGFAPAIIVPTAPDGSAHSQKI